MLLLPLSLRTSVSAFFPFSWLLQARITRAFLFARSIAVSFPIPVFPPVMITVLPSSIALDRHTPPAKYFRSIHKQTPTAAIHNGRLPGNSVRFIIAIKSSTISVCERNSLVPSSCVNKTVNDFIECFMVGFAKIRHRFHAIIVH